MAIYRAQISFPTDSLLPRDELVITPHFNGDNPGALCNALKANLIAHGAVGIKPFKIKVYDALKAPPSYPLATAEQTGTQATSIGPREVSLCLSYYATYNRPSYRGRVYLPNWLLGGSCDIRPTVAQRDAALLFHQVLTQNLPSAHRFAVYSRKFRESYSVSDFWVDDEWDTVRARGLRGTARVTAKI